ncbi:ATP-binding protein [Sphingomonas rustica]
MVARIALVLLCALGLELAGNLVLHRIEMRLLVSRDDSRQIAARLIHAEQVAASVPQAGRAARMRAISAPGLALNWVPATVITDFSPSLEPLAAMRARLAGAAPRLDGDRLRLSLLPSQAPGRRDLVGALELSDGSFVTFRVTPFLGAPLPLAMIVAFHLLLMAMVLGVALAMVRALVRPLRTLAEAADATGRGRLGRIEPEGPDEVRRVAIAFDAMQTRLLRMMEDHAQALVAVSHDLRTPIQRLKLRASLLDDDEAQSGIAGDLSEMERFIESTLAYVRSGDEEAVRLVDLSALLATAVDDAGDAGAQIRFDGPDELGLPGRPVALRRMIDNLIGNARRHAARIVVSLIADKDRATILVDDDGPGIPPDHRAEALLPFHRLDPARGNGLGGGAGLGLASALRTAAGLGGTLTLGEAPLGGLRVRIDLPLSGPVSPASRRGPAPASAPASEGDAPRRPRHSRRSNGLPA